jgi:hypothetical protein
MIVECFTISPGERISSNAIALIDYLDSRGLPQEQVAQLVVYLVSILNRKGRLDVVDLVATVKEIRLS